MSARSYEMLVSSLPPLPPRFEESAVPISRERLETRLGLLDPKDAADVDRVLTMLEWRRQVVTSTDEAVKKRYDAVLAEVRNPLARELIELGMAVHTIIAALRRRRLGLGAPAVGLGERALHVRRHFNQPEFGLGNVFPWIAPFAELLAHDEVLTLYRRTLAEEWTWARRRAQDFDMFSFEAIVLYLARWAVMRAWQDLQVQRGWAVFEPLVTEAMGRHAKLAF